MVINTNSRSIAFHKDNKKLAHNIRLAVIADNDNHLKSNFETHHSDGKPNFIINCFNNFDIPQNARAKYVFSGELN